MNNLYALFVGINKYANIRPLSGCLNDVQRMMDFFQKYTQGEFLFHPQALLADKATKNGIVNAFRKQLVRDDLTPGDVLLFYFSGHGAEEDAHEVFWHSEPNKKLQVLACYDSDLDTGENFLADKELRYLLRQAARPGVEVVTIFDCCHSGDNTRALAPGGVTERLAGQVRQRAWGDFIFAQEISPAVIKEKTLEKALPQGKHLQLAACDTHESAYEENYVGGFFTTALLGVLNQSQGDISYLELKNRVKNAIKGLKPQTPLAYAYVGQDEATSLGATLPAGNALFKSFLGGAIKDKPIESEVYFNTNEKRWEVDKGAIYGVTETWEGVPQQVVVPISADNSAIATVKQVFPGFSVIEFEPYADVFHKEHYFGASIPSLMTRTISVSVTGEQAGVDVFLQKSPPQQLLEAGIRLVKKGQKPDYNVLAKSGQYLITLPGDERPLTQQTKDISYKSIMEVHAHLKKIGRWAFVKNLRNENSADISAKAFDVLVTQNGQPVSTSGDNYALELPEINEKGLPSGRLEILLTNGTMDNLYYGIVYMDNLFKVDPDNLPGMVKLLEARSEQALTTSVSIEKYIRDFNWKEEPFHLLIIAAASHFSLDQLGQEGLQEPTKGLVNFNELRSVRTRGMLRPESWQTRLLTFILPNPDFKP